MLFLVTRRSGHHWSNEQGFQKPSIINRSQGELARKYRKSARRTAGRANADLMKILDIRETVVPINSAIRNAYVDFSQMTVSVVALITDVIRDGKPVVGFGFNSNGRYAPSGLLHERFIPRLKAAEPARIVDDTGENLDPFRVWTVLMQNEKPGGHG